MLSENGSTSTRPLKRAAAATTPSPSQPAAAKEAWGTLILQMNADDTQTFELKDDKAHIIGRASNVDIRADLPHVSAAHMTIREAGVSQSGGVVVRVMDISSNGTCLNDAPVGRNMERELRDGDCITFTKLSAKSDSATEYPRLVFRAAPNAAPNRRSKECSKRSRASVAPGDAQAGGDEGGDATGPAWLVSDMLNERLKFSRMKEKHEP
jgi:pSer/pThr/pTyr-binding forkhead associated (FHA) protein